MQRAPREGQQPRQQVHREALAHDERERAAEPEDEAGTESSRGGRDGRPRAQQREQEHRPETLEHRNGKLQQVGQQVAPAVEVVARGVEGDARHRVETRPGGIAPPAVADGGDEDRDERTHEDARPQCEERQGEHERIGTEAEGNRGPEAEPPRLAPQPVHDGRAGCEQEARLRVDLAAESRGQRRHGHQQRRPAACPGCEQFGRAVCGHDGERTEDAAGELPGLEGVHAAGNRQGDQQRQQRREHLGHRHQQVPARELHGHPQVRGTVLRRDHGQHGQQVPPAHCGDEQPQQPAAVGIGDGTRGHAGSMAARHARRPPFFSSGSSTRSRAVPRRPGTPS